MTDREKLIELLEDTVYANVETDDGFVGFEVDCNKIAEHLLANGVIVPPCNLGDKVYVLLKNGFPDKDYGYKKGVNEIEAYHIRIRKDGIFVSDFWGFIDWKFGERAFLTKDEAEKKLKELRNGTT